MHNRTTVCKPRVWSQATRGYPTSDATRDSINQQLSHLKFKLDTVTLIYHRDDV